MSDHDVETMTVTLEVSTAAFEALEERVYERHPRGDSAAGYAVARENATVHPVCSED
ncbi:hypothetical protein [Haloarcula nitratireducens]|uniref:Uncharacterized protein n=1 Tax=Haloarcula nitratireducens TaxID=2487749 RepID=A0AAW4PIY0_9EURY|nr:hypothetical protein [Halomicroarcula nitratireducens]MBX0297513.1 hypothetical protein [Halomicroarcula nitratireducens]